MFVYLDHAHISALDDTLRREPESFGQFLEFWLDHQCELIISRAHLHEIGQSVDESDVEKRLEVLRYFSVWSGDIQENVDWVVIRNSGLRRCIDFSKGRAAYQNHIPQSATTFTVQLTTMPLEISCAGRA